MRMRTPRDFGALIRDHRRKRGWSQQELARHAGVRRQWLVATEKGNPGASLSLVLRTMNVLGIALEAGAEKRPAGKAGRTQRPVDIDQLLDRLRNKKP